MLCRGAAKALRGGGWQRHELLLDFRPHWVAALAANYRILHGKTFLTYRWVISHIQINPPIPPGAFDYHPTAADSLIPTSIGEPAKRNAEVFPPEAAAASLVGRRMPELEARNTAYKPVSLAEVAKGKATILTLWATWCVPCVAEFPAFQTAVDRHPEFQVVALGTQDSRLNVLNFIEKHTEYKFIFLTDPHTEDDNSAISKFFAGEGIPRNAFIDPQGRIVEYHVGSYEGRPDDLTEKVDKWMNQLKLAQ
jgi:thiol-disulfide isomerase/thioredoxin